MKKFSEWLKDRVKNEVATSTASVASFSRPVGHIVRRNKKEKNEKRNNRR